VSDGTRRSRHLHDHHKAYVWPTGGVMRWQGRLFWRDFGGSV
jgi:hypothetical protein